MAIINPKLEKKAGQKGADYAQNFGKYRPAPSNTNVKKR